MKNVTRLENLFQNGSIQLDRGALFDWDVSPKPPDFDFDRIEGMLLGVAIGDSLGITTEGKLPSARRSVHGEIRDYLPNRYTGVEKGFPSDDTQLTFWTLEQLIEDGSLVPENLARKFSSSGKIYGLGSTVRGFLRNLKSGRSWYESGPKSAGNGALMRISPILIPHLRSGGTDIWADTALASMMTHNDRASTSSCLAFVAMLWELLEMSSPPPSQWWIERYVELAGDLEGENDLRPRGGAFCDYEGSLWRFVEEKLSKAYDEGLNVRDAGYFWYSGAFLLETVPNVLYILMRHAHDPEEAIVRAVNDTKDNDTIAAIVGAAVGALHGRSGIPDRWIENLLGRTTNQKDDRDDGHVFKLIDHARNNFWKNDVSQ